MKLFNLVNNVPKRPKKILIYIAYLIILLVVSDLILQAPLGSGIGNSVKEFYGSKR